MSKEFFCLHEHTYPGLNYKTIIQTKADASGILHDHDYYEITLVTSGNIEHYINLEKRILSAGTLLLIRPQDVHRFKIISDDSEYMNMNFSAELMDMLLAFWDDEELSSEIKTSKFPIERKLDYDDCLYAAGKLLKTMFNENSTFSELTYTMKKALFDLFAKFFVKSSKAVGAGIPKWLSYTVIEMKKKENFSQGISKMTEISGKTKEHISRSFLKYYNMTPTQFVNIQRVNYMSSMLAYSDWPIIDIWLDAGFQSAAYAYKLFKKTFGVTPDGYRKNMSE